MLTRSHIQSLGIALVVIAMGAIPVLFAVESLRSTQGAVVDSRQHDTVLEATFEVRSKVEKHLLYFAASALDLNDRERQAMLRKANRHLREFRDAITKLSEGTNDQLLPAEREGLQTGISELLHNWEEINGNLNEGMSNVEKTWHFLSMVENFERLNNVLLGLHKRVASEHDDGLREIFTNIEMAILTIVGLMIVGTSLASIGLGGSNFLLNTSKAQAAQLQDSNDLLRHREETLRLQAIQLRESNDLLKRREEALRIQTDRFSSAIEHMAQGLCMIDKNHRLITWNKAFAEMYAIPANLLQEGLPYLAVLEYRIKSGSAPKNCADFVNRELGTNDSTDAHGEICELPDGRFISSSYEQTPEGGLLATHRDVTKRRQSEQQIIHLAHHDGLTSLLNRRFFVERLDDELKEAKSGKGLALFAIDLDDFKLANDKFGHAAGDLVLQTVASRLKECTRSHDLIARVGGDEFAVVLPGESSQEAVTKFASRLVDELSRPYDFEGQIIEIGSSVGAAMAPHDACEADGLMKTADVALYEAKNEGRNRFRLFSAELLDKMLERRELEEALGHAQERGQFELHYQPIICARSGLVVGMEALVRWSHPELGAIPPTKFIPIAEDLGLMGKLGTWVIERACLDAAQWPSPIRVAVNVSAAQIHSRTLELDVAVALGKSCLPGDRLELEITESVLLDDEDKVLTTIDSIQELGVSVSMDDFGTGFSSLSYLHKYPLDKIKIDRSFIADLPGSNYSQSIVRTIVSLAKSLGMSTTAEGIETAEQLALLKEEGCDQLQGYLISKAVPAASAVELIRTLNSPGCAAA
ncbi:MAG: putative bifunctional diguanylate cyclase/phosphodiesterase [Hyphomicrobiaceae bacterium]